MTRLRAESLAEKDVLVSPITHAALEGLQLLICAKISRGQMLGRRRHFTLQVPARRHYVTRRVDG